VLRAATGNSKASWEGLSAYIRCFQEFFKKCLFIAIPNNKASPLKEPLNKPFMV